MARKQVTQESHELQHSASAYSPLAKPNWLHCLLFPAPTCDGTPAALLRLWRNRAPFVACTCGGRRLRSTVCNERSTLLVPLTRYGITGALLRLRRNRPPSIACASLDLPNQGRRVACGSLILLFCLAAPLQLVGQSKATVTDRPPAATALKARPGLNFDPPRIVVSEKPSRLMLIDGPPATVAIDSTRLEFVVNTNWTVFKDANEDAWFILDEGSWLTSSMLSSGDWISTVKLPGDFLTLQVSSDWPEVARAMPPRKPDSTPLPITISYEPTELVLIDGAMELERIADTGLEYVTNTKADLFLFQGRYYLLLSGRWFSTKDMKRKWYSVGKLPAEFSNIPETHVKAGVLAAVPGTRAAQQAVEEAAKPRIAVIDSSAGEELSVPYIGEPRFIVIEGTVLRRAENTPFQVIRHNNYFYLCHEGAWYSSSNPRGPGLWPGKFPRLFTRFHPPTRPTMSPSFVSSLLMTPVDEQRTQAVAVTTAGTTPDQPWCMVPVGIIPGTTIVQCTGVIPILMDTVPGGTTGPTVITIRLPSTRMFRKRTGNGTSMATSGRSTGTGRETM